MRRLRWVWKNGIFLINIRHELHETQKKKQKPEYPTFTVGWPNSEYFRVVSVSFYYIERWQKAVCVRARDCLCAWQLGVGYKRPVNGFRRCDCVCALSFICPCVSLRACITISCGTSIVVLVGWFSGNAFSIFLRPRNFVGRPLSLEHFFPCTSVRNDAWLRKWMRFN